MASFDYNLDLFVDQWLLRPPTSPPLASWFSDPFPSHTPNSFSYLLDSPITSSQTHTPSPTQSISLSGSGLGSDHETDSIPNRPGPGPTRKRKPRASKKKGSTTTFINADAANFREMVQEVTGVKLPPNNYRRVPYAAPVVRPEPQRAVGCAVGGLVFGCLPTLDTSAFFLDRHDAGARAAAVAEVGGEAGGRSAGFDFDGFSCFPTLESGKVM